MLKEILLPSNSAFIPVMIVSFMIVGLMYLCFCYLIRPSTYQFILFTDRSKFEKRKYSLETGYLDAICLWTVDKYCLWSSRKLRV